MGALCEGGLLSVHAWALLDNHFHLLIHKGKQILSEEQAGVGGEGEEDILSGGASEVRIHGGVGGEVFGDDDVLGEPDGETGGDDGVGYVGQVICL